ncbi:ABC transporter ATP-binding protein [Pseudoclavibacter sp. CFCC 13611]|uniref:ABC transporter ATP-binding protein n=1 Tax=Pseudoclavibacter sp. CFCC 13611 TaxID=2615178 RepID=UPI001CE48985|nr:ABC transporter ATP-binding protein [Pseudoclavibacter sp. CFCC 13611]
MKRASGETVHALGRTSSALELQDLRYTYGRTGRHAVDGINLCVEDGQMLTLLGPSGCGKTTTLQMIAGLLQPSSGRVLVGGRDITPVPVHRRNMGVVFQDYALFPHLSVGRNVSFGLEMRGITASERARRVNDVLALVGLDSVERRGVAELSGGQRQRVALARALVIDPSILLLDEPLSNLDATLRTQLRDEIRAAQLRSGTTAVFVTHDQQEALAVSDRIAVLSDGHVEQVGTPNDVFDRPTTRFVATFIGQTNVLDGTLVDTRGGIAEVSVPGVGRLPGATGTGQAGREAGVVGKAGVFTVHPHRLQVTAADAGRLNGTVTRVTFTGSLVQTVMAVGEDPHRVELRTEQFSVPGTDHPRVGDHIGVTWRPNDAWVIR